MPAEMHICRVEGNLSPLRKPQVVAVYLHK